MVDIVVVTLRFSNGQEIVLNDVAVNKPIARLEGDAFAQKDYSRLWPHALIHTTAWKLFMEIPVTVEQVSALGLATNP